MNIELTMRCCVEQPRLHARWLNTLAFMENIGARKIKRYESLEFVTADILRHGFEEARHAFYLKSMISKLGFDYCPTFTRKELLAPSAARHYLGRLDTGISRILKREQGYNGERLRKGAYLLVTYVIEVRAKALYPLYEELLREINSPLSVKNIITEEENHLGIVGKEIRLFFGPQWRKLVDQAGLLEGSLFFKLQTALAQAVQAPQRNTITSNGGVTSQPRIRPH